MDPLPPIETSPVAPPPGDAPEALEAKLLDEATRLAPGLGWNGRLVAAAAREAGVSPGEAALVLPEGARDLVALLSRRHDAAALAALSRHAPATLKVRERIRLAVELRVEAAMAHEAAVRRATGFLMLPLNASLAMRLAWESADHLWRWAGDVATDENHYSKRAILSGVLGATLAARLSGGPAGGRRALDAALNRVMAFERWKAGAPRPSAGLRDLAARMGELRYGRDRDRASH